MAHWNQALDVTRFGQSGNPDDLYREYEIDSDSIMAASFAALGTCYDTGPSILPPSRSPAPERVNRR